MLLRELVRAERALYGRGSWVARSLTVAVQKNYALPSDRASKARAS